MASEPARSVGHRPSGADIGTAPRILVLAESLPYPTLKGGDLRTWQNVNALAGFARVGVFGLCSNDSRRVSLPDVSLECWAASTDAALTSPPPKGVRLAARAWLLDPAGHPSDLYFSESAARELGDLLARLRADIVLIEGLWLHRYLDVARAAGCRTILDCHNVEAAVFRELTRTSHGQRLEARVVRDILPVRTEAIEGNAVRAVDQLWVCSAEDECRLRDTYDPPVPIVVVPNGVRVADYQTTPEGKGRLPSAAPLTLVYPGIFSYLPNAVAAAFLVEEILPRLAAGCEGDYRLLLVGAMPTPELLAAAALDPRIVVTGPVRDVRSCFAAATAMPVPLFQGGGTRMKVLEAFAAGVPVVSTMKGVEGLGVRDGMHLLIAESAADFVDALIAIWRDPTLADRLTANARALVAERFSWETVGTRIRQAVDALEHAA
jgi:glycosyltransferase involved in cell wall biosynthesis